MKKQISKIPQRKLLKTRAEKRAILRMAVFKTVLLLILTVFPGMTAACAGEKQTDTLFLLTGQDGEARTQTGEMQDNAAYAGAERENASHAAVCAQQPENASGDGAGEETATIYVHICGEVISPGVYEVAAGSRIYDVLLLAGGFSEAADREYLNLAAVAADGMQIVILSEEEADAEKLQKRNESKGLVNINTASAEELCTLPGIGVSRAEDIIAYRSVNGSFESTEDIMQIAGIKTALYEKLKDKICVE